MLRYIALVWDPQDQAATERAHELTRSHRERKGAWKTAIETPGLVVLYTDKSPTDRLQILPVGCGVVFGSLLYKPDPDHDDASTAQATLSAAETERIIATGARELISRYWGDYVALFREWNSSAVRVVRGPSSTLRCLHAKSSRLDFYFSDVEIYADLVDQPFSIDWRAVARTFLGPEPPGCTHLKEVRELPPGYCHRVFRGRTIPEILWDPARLCRAPQFDDPHEAARILRNVTRSCIHSRAEEFSSIVMALSGGLDSTITLSCLATSPSRPHVICLTQYGEDTDSDERRYARIAAKAAHCDLVEFARNAIPDLREATYSRRLDMSPGLRIPQVDRIEPDVAQSHGAQAIFDGNGGDEIFCRVHHWLYVSDYLRARGFGAEFMPLLLNAAFTEGVTVWRILARSTLHAIFPSRTNVSALLAKDIHGSTLLRRDLIEDLIEQSRTQASEPATRVSPGRTWQNALLTSRRSHPSPFARPGEVARVSPLLSQPILETCLRIPTWFQCSGRRDRALARDAFAADIPREIATRYDKGGAEALASAMIERNLPFLHEMLLDGVVASSGIIDRVRLEAALCASPSSESVSSVPIFDLLGAEIWARAWGHHERSSRQNLWRTERLYEGNSSRP